VLPNNIILNYKKSIGRRLTSCMGLTVFYGKVVGGNITTFPHTVGHGAFPWIHFHE
jgi:muramoyltetrapeptide carboxypeptidase LdcA involved in peptidoglycan recycling